jgi:hypothetical protein
MLTSPVMAGKVDLVSLTKWALIKHRLALKIIHAMKLLMLFRDSFLAVVSRRKMS